MCHTLLNWTENVKNVVLGEHRKEKGGLLEIRNIELSRWKLPKDKADFI